MSTATTAAAREGHGRSSEPGTLSWLIEERALTAHFQPIVELRAAQVHAHESLVRGPIATPLALPDALFEAARRASLVTTLELECARIALSSWARSGAAGKLFMNLSASALTAALSGSRLEASLQYLAGCGVPPNLLVVELTEHEHVADLAALHGAVELLRLRGVQLALDDFGDGRSSLRLWSELKPDYVKIDKYFTRNLATDADKLQTFRALLQIAETFGSELVAEGIETAADLRVLRDLGVRYGQGWFLGRPQALPVAAPLSQALDVLQGRDVAVLPESRTVAGRHITAAQLLVQAPTVGPRTTHDELYRLFAADEQLNALAVVHDGRPVALVERQQFINRYARPYFKELYGRSSCLKFANREALAVELSAGVDDLLSLLTAADQRYLREGFIITERGAYRGLGTGQALVKAVTEARIEAARHANPLTLLPGNIPVSQHIERLLKSGGDFVAAHVDLNSFKPYNDHYGYWRGDEMIRLAAGIVVANADAQRDFVGHIGGDDFVVIFQSADWAERCSRIVNAFNRRALELFTAEARTAGGIVSEDRNGDAQFYPCTTLSIGIACVTVGTYASAEDVAAAATTAKRMAKQERRGCYVVEGGLAA